VCESDRHFGYHRLFTFHYFIIIIIFIIVVVVVILTVATATVIARPSLRRLYRKTVFSRIPEHNPFLLYPNIPFYYLRSAIV